MQQTKSDEAHHRVYRSAGTLWAAIGSTVGVVVFLVLGVAGGRGSIAAFVVAALLLVLAWRLWAAGIHVEKDGVNVATIFGSRRAPWGDIDHFAVMPLGRFPYVGFVVLRNGDQFGTFGLSSSSRQTESNRLQVQRPIDELNQVLATRRGNGGRE